MTGRTPILVSAAVLVVMTWAIPIRLPRLASAPSSAACVTLPDAAPDPARVDLIGVLERCTALDAGDVELMADLGLQYEAVGRFSSAEAVYRRALSIDPLYADLRLRLGRLLLQRGDRAAARREAEAALRVQPNRQTLLDLLRESNSGEALATDAEPIR